MNTSTVNLKYVFFLAIVAALGGFLFGYDTAVISGTISHVASQFGLSTIESGWFVGCALIGSIIGALLGGVLADNLGRKQTMLISALLFVVSAIGCAISPTFNFLVISRVIGGVAIGIVSIVSPLYISEISIPKYRGQLVALYQLAITIGFLGAYLVNFGLLSLSESEFIILRNSFWRFLFYDEIWRAMLGMALLPAIIFFSIVLFIPESPRWLVLKKKESRAINILEQIYKTHKIALSEVDAIKSVTTEKNDWKVIFSPGIRRAVFIGAAIAMLGQFMGVNAVLYYGPTIFESTGLSSGDSLFYQVFIGLVNMITTIIAISIIDKIGRKQLVYYGVSGMIASLLLIIFYFTQAKALALPSTLLLVFFLLYVFCTAISISAVIFVFLSEMYPTKVRGIAMSIAGFSLWVGTYLVGQLTPWLLENLTPAGTFLLFALMCIPYMLIVWKLMPETTGKSLEDIEKFWEK